MKLFNLPSLKHVLIFSLLLVLVIYLRSFNLAELFPFTMDEAYQGFLVKRIITGENIPLIGVNVAGTGLYLGPLFTWVSTIPYYFSSLDPIGTAVAQVLLATTTAAMLWITTSKVFKNHLSAHLALLLYAVNPLINLYDRKFYNPSVVPLLTLIWLLSLSNSVKKPKWFIGVVLVFALAFHIHYSLFALAPATIYFLYKNKPRITFKIKILSLGLFLVLLSPLLLFEAKHDFLQTHALIKLITGNNAPAGEAPIFTEKITVFFTSLDRLFWLGWHKDIALEITNCATLIKNHPGLPLSVAGILLTAWLYTKKKHTQVLTMVSLTGISLLGGSLLFPSTVAEYYFLSFFPLAIILLAVFLTHQLNLQKHPRSATFLRNPWIYVCSIVAISWLAQTLSITNHLGLAKKQRLLKKAIATIGGAPYHLEAVGDCFKYEGYRFLTESLDTLPEISYMDPFFEWLYLEDGPKQVDYNLVILDSLDTFGSQELQKLDQLLNESQNQSILIQDGQLQLIIAKSGP